MKPQRIASLLASATEMLAGLGLSDRLVAVSHECDFPASVVAGKPRVTRTKVAAEATSAQIDRQVRQCSATGEALYEIDVDRLVELRPEVIVTQAQCDVCAVRYEDVLDVVENHESLSATRVVALNPMTLGDIFDDLRRIGRETDSTIEADRYVAALTERVEAVRRRTAALPDARRPRVACLEWIEPPMLAANWMPELILLAGGRPSLSKAGRHSSYTPWEAIVREDPDVLIVMPCGFDLQRTLVELAPLKQLGGWSSLRAVRQGRVFAVDGNAYFNRSGPRIVDSLEILTQLIHPEQITPPDFDQRDRPIWQRIDV